MSEPDCYSAKPEKPRADDLLHGEQRPSVNQIAWVFAHLADSIYDEGCTFRSLIYRRMGLDERAYTPLYLAGGMQITNAFSDACDWVYLRKQQRENGA